MEMTSRVFLVGFMGSGKSTLGKLIAAELGFSFLDLDQAIEEKYHNTISEIFSLHGEQGFREFEKDTLHSLVADTQVVIATGGGTPCFYDNMLWMLDHGLVIFLNCSVEVLMQRLQSEKEHRPLINHLDHTALQTFIEHKLSERLPFYSKAHLEVFDFEDKVQTARWIGHYVQSLGQGREISQ